VKSRPGSSPRPPRGAKLSTMKATARHSTIPRGLPRQKTRPKAAERPKHAKLALGRAKHPRPPHRQVAHIIDEESTLLDLIDNLLEKGVMLNAELILALANVDLVYLRLSALLCAADRVMSPLRFSSARQARR
jgi:hypothetical protein